MRRLIVTLLSVLMLVALVPAAATAAPPPDPVISTITVTSGGDYEAGGTSCRLTVRVAYNTYRGVARVKWSQELNGNENSWPEATPARKSTEIGYTFNDLLYGSQVRYTVELLNRKGVVLSAATTGSYTFPTDSCPASNTVLARYPVE